MKIKTLIIDDEALNRDLIAKLITKFGENFDVVGQAEDIDLGVKLIKELNPDLVFLDIKMPGGDGFDLLHRFEKPNFEVVFITGFDEYALKAFEFNALDYLLKPIDINKLKHTLSNVYERISQKLSLIDNLKCILSSYDNSHKIITKIPIHHNDKVELLDIYSIVSISSENGYTLFKVADLNQFISSKQINAFDFILNKFTNFIKISKGVYLNANYIKSYSKGMTCIINMKNGDSFEISRRKKSEILEVLKYKQI